MVIDRVKMVMDTGRFNRWTVLGTNPKYNYVECICDCGNAGTVRVDDNIDYIKEKYKYYSDKEDV